MPTYIVDNTGGGDFTTLGAALAAGLSNGDTVLLRDGQTFAEGDLVASGAPTGVTIGRTPGVGYGPNLAGEAQPLINASGFARAFQPENDWTIDGLAVQNASGYAFDRASGYATGVTVRNCTATLCAGLVTAGDDSVAEYVWCLACTGSSVAIGFIGTTGNRVSFAVVMYSEGRIYCGAQNGLIEHSVWRNPAGAPSGVRMYAGASGGVIRNSIVFNPGTGCDGMSAVNGTNGYNGCCVLLDDATRTPYIGHTPGSPPPTCLEADPLFAGAGDVHLTPESPCINAGTSELTATLSRDLDGNTQRFGRYDIGCYFAVLKVGLAIVRGLIKGTHLVDLMLDTAGQWRPEAESAHRWTLVAGGGLTLPEQALVVRVARAEIDANDTRKIRLRTDVPLYEGVSYLFLFDASFNPSDGGASTGSFLYAAGADYLLGGPAFPGSVVVSVENYVIYPETPFWVTGGRVSKTPLGDPRSVLSDFAAPIFEGDGFGGGVRIGDGGDYQVRGGEATIEKMVWATLLTRKGELKHDPSIGTRLRVKEPIPSLPDEEKYLAARLRAIPYVDDASVRLKPAAANAVDVAVAVRTAIGLVRTRRTVSRSLTA